MNTIGDLLKRDLNQRIEEIIKVDQTDEHTVHTEISEYVVTERIREQFRDLLKAIADAPAEPHEGVGVWVSGFFGSGKSSFAKILGYILANRTVMGQRVSELFKQRVEDQQIADYVDFINERIPTKVIMFDLQVDRAVTKSTENISEILYTVLLRELDYAEDFDVAELEIELEAEGQLDRFVEFCQERYEIAWHKVRKGAQKISRASALLHQLDATTYPNEDTWAQSLRDASVSITVGKLVERTFELTARRRPGKALTFIVDEMGRYVANSAEKIENLRAIVEQFGKTSKNLLKANKILAPVWLIVTSQEKLDEVVDAIGSRRVELAKMQDRFRYRIDMAPADIREVATKRVLTKTDEAKRILRARFSESQGKLINACRLSRTTRTSELEVGTFADFYPYLPHYIDLSIDIMSGIRLQPGAPKHLGGSNRTIIKQVYEMLASDKTALAQKPIGSLVTLDKVFDLVEHNLSSERQKDISDIRERCAQSRQTQSMELRVAKALCLLEYIRDLPRTEDNVAALLVEHVGDAPPKTEVKRALEALFEAKFIRNTDEGWKLQTAQEKNWETERRSISPRPKDRHDILREALDEIFSDQKLKTYRHRDLKNFRIGISLNGNAIGDEGHIHVSLSSSEEQGEFQKTLDDVRKESRQNSNTNTLYWVFSLNPDIDQLIAELYASRQMVTKYEQLRAQNRISPTESACLSDEKNQVLRSNSRLREKVTETLKAGTGLFRGVSKEGSSLGKSLSETFRGLFETSVPDLYPKLELGARPLNGTEAEDLLKAANLNGLPQVFYGGEEGLNLVIEEGDKYVPNSEAAICKEVLDYLKREHSYGERDSCAGKALEAHFGGLGYGWDRDVLRLALSVLFRAGSIEVYFGGKVFDSYQNPQSREPFIKTRPFQSAVFTPAKPLDLQTLTQAVKGFEQLTGESVDVEKNAISTVLKAFTKEELETLVQLKIQVQSNQMPCADELEEYQSTLQLIQNGTADECVQILAGGGASLKEARNRIRKLRHAVEGDGIVQFQRGRIALEKMWPGLSASGQHQDVHPQTEALGKLLERADFYNVLDEIQELTQQISTPYLELYKDLHVQRQEHFQAAVERITGHAAWTELPAELQDIQLRHLVSRDCEDLELGDDQVICLRCSATIQQMESDLAALNGLTQQVLAKIQELSAPLERVKRVRLSEYFTEPLDSPDAVQRAIERLQSDLSKLVDEGVRIIVE